MQGGGEFPTLPSSHRVLWTRWVCWPSAVRRHSTAPVSHPIGGRSTGAGVCVAIHAMPFSCWIGGCLVGFVPVVRGARKKRTPRYRRETPEKIGKYSPSARDSVGIGTLYKIIVSSFQFRAIFLHWDWNNSPFFWFSCNILVSRPILWFPLHFSGFTIYFSGFAVDISCTLVVTPSPCPGASPPCMAGPCSVAFRHEFCSRLRDYPGRFATALS